MTDVLTRTVLKASEAALRQHEALRDDALRRIAEEAERQRKEGEAKARKTAAGKRRTGEIVIQMREVAVDGRPMVMQRVVRKYMTTLDKLTKRGQLPKHLRLAFDQFAEAVAISSGACVLEEDLRNGSSAGIASWEANGTQFGPKSVSHQALRAENLRQAIERHIPIELRRLASQMLMEETGQSLDKPDPLTIYGNQLGFQQDQQAQASGATQAVDICRIVHHALKNGR